MTHKIRFGLVAFSSLVFAFSQAAARAQETAAEPAAEEKPTEVIRDPDAEAAYKEGLTALEAGQFKPAVVAMGKAISIDPYYTEAYIGKGLALNKLEDYEPATVAFTNALNLNPNSPQAYNGRGVAQMERGLIDMATNDFRTALELDPNNPEVLANFGHILVNFAGDPNGALLRLNSALELNPNDARAHRDRGLAHVQLQQFKESIADMEAAVAADPNDYENYRMLATIYQFQDQWEPAVEAMTKAIETYKPKTPNDPPQFLDGYLLRADARAKMAEKETDTAARKTALDASIADADAVLAVYDDRYPSSGIAFYRKGRALRMLGRYSDAVDALTDAIELVPADQDSGYTADAYLYRGICWYYIGQNDLARGDFEQASSTGNGFMDPRVFLWIGFTHHAEEDYRAAIESYSQAIAKAPKFALAHVNKGRAYIDLGEYTKAIECFNDAIRAEPSVGEHYYNVGFAYVQQKEYDKAVEFLNLALKKDNPQPKMYRLMARSLRELGRGELAEEYERKASAAEPQASGG